MLKLQTLRLDRFGSEGDVGETVCISKHLENRFPRLCYFKTMHSKVCHKSSNLEREFTGDMKMQKSSHFLFTDTFRKSKTTVHIFFHSILNQNQNQNELYWPGMFTHTRNLL